MSYADWPEEKKRRHDGYARKWREANPERNRLYKRKTYSGSETDARVTAQIRAFALHRGFYE